jgi:hypothetical protein
MTYRTLSHVEICYTDGYRITISKNELENLKEASDAIELLENAKTQAKRFLELTEPKAKP